MRYLLLVLGPQDGLAYEGIKSTTNCTNFHQLYYCIRVHVCNAWLKQFPHRTDPVPYHYLIINYSLSKMMKTLFSTFKSSIW